MLQTIIGDAFSVSYVHIFCLTVAIFNRSFFLWLLDYTIFISLAHTVEWATYF